jgi:hypothetical protein
MTVSKNRVSGKTKRCGIERSHDSFNVYGRILEYTIPIRQGRRKIILKIDAKKFREIIFLYGENKSLPE